MSRPERVAQALKEEMSRIIHDELNDPRMGFVTVLNVEVTRDLRCARAFYSVYGDKETREKTKKALEGARGFIRKLIGERIRLRFVPELVFKLDESAEYLDSVEKVLERIKREKG